VALPGDLTTITVTGSYSDGAGNPQSGSVLFIPSNSVTDQAGKVIVARVPVAVSLAGGSFSLAGLACTDNANLIPAGWWWVITVAVAGAATTFSAYLPSTLGASADMSVISPEVALPTAQVTGPSAAPQTYAQQAGGLAVPYVSSVNGVSGVVTVAGAALLATANTWQAANTFTQGVTVPGGTGGYAGTVTLNGTTAVTVTATSLTAKGYVLLTTQAPAGTPGAPYVASVTPGSGFTVKSTGVADTSAVAWLIVNHT
jgi:hypothetical protein